MGWLSALGFLEPSHSVYVWVGMCEFVCLYECVCACVYAFVCVSVYMYVCVHVFGCV